MQRDEARRLLRVLPGASVADVERAFRRHAQAAHPDRGGDARTFRDLVAARSALRGAYPGHVAQQPGTRSPLVVRRSRARRLLRALRARIPNRPAPRIR